MPHPPAPRAADRSIWTAAAAAPRLSLFTTISIAMRTVCGSADESRYARAPAVMASSTRSSSLSGPMTIWRMPGRACFTFSRVFMPSEEELKIHDRCSRERGRKQFRERADHWDKLGLPGSGGSSNTPTAPRGGSVRPRERRSGSCSTWIVTPMVLPGQRQTAFRAANRCGSPQAFGPCIVGNSRYPRRPRLTAWEERCPVVSGTCPCDRRS